MNLTGRAWHYNKEERRFSIQDIHSFFVKCCYDENGNSISYTDSNKAWGYWVYDKLGCVTLSKFSDNYHTSIFQTQILTNY